MFGTDLNTRVRHRGPAARPRRRRSERPGHGGSRRIFRQPGNARLRCAPRSAPTPRRQLLDRDSRLRRRAAFDGELRGGGAFLGAARGPETVGDDAAGGAFGFLKGKSSGRSGCRHHKTTARTIAIWTIGDTVSRIRVAVKSRAGPTRSPDPVRRPATSCAPDQHDPVELAGRQHGQRHPGEQVVPGQRVHRGDQPRDRQHQRRAQGDGQRIPPQVGILVQTRSRRSRAPPGTASRRSRSSRRTRSRRR